MDFPDAAPSPKFQTTSSISIQAGNHADTGLPPPSSRHTWFANFGRDVWKALSPIRQERALSLGKEGIMSIQGKPPSQGRPLTEKELASYRRQLAELDEAAHRPGGDLSRCDTATWDIFDPNGWRGRQIYDSFSSEELLDVVIRTMAHRGHKPDYNDIYCVCLRYLRRRFGNLAEVTEQAKRRMRNEQQWPIDWPERVSVTPILEKRWREPPDETELALLKDLCRRARETGMTPELTPEEKARLNKFGGAGQVMKMMGIPILRGSELRHLKKYWQEEREKQAAGAATKNMEETK